MQEHILLHIVSLIEHYYPDSAAAHQNNFPLSPAENTAADSLPHPGTYTAERTSLLPAAHSTAAAGASQFPAADGTAAGASQFPAAHSTAAGASQFPAAHSTAAAEAFRFPAAHNTAQNSFLLPVGNYLQDLPVKQAASFSAAVQAAPFRA